MLPRSIAESQHRFRDAFAAIELAIAERAFPGASVAILEKGQFVARNAFGRFTYELDSSAVTPETIYDLASVSKVVATTTAMAILYERGKLDLDNCVADLAPEFGANDIRRYDVTIRHLLSHTSGLPPYARFFEHATTKQELLAAAYATPLEADPGVRTEYSDIGFIILGAILEQIAGEPLDRFCKSEIFDPLALTQTRFCPPADWRDRIPPTRDDRDFRKKVIQGEVNDENAWVMGGVAGHAGIFSTAADVARFAQCWLGGGSPILKSKTVAQFTCQQHGTGRALGWDRPTAPSSSGKYFSPQSYGHLGYTGTSLWIDPTRELAVVLLTNRTWPDARNQAIKQIRPRFHDAVIEAL